MDAAALRAFCLTLPGAFEDYPFGPETAVYKVGAAVDGDKHPPKVFALSALRASPLSVSLKCEPVLAQQLRQAHPQITGAFHLNKKHWNGVILDGLPDAMIRDMVEDSYDLVVASLPRRQREQLGWSRLSR
ncbi:MmcQ/YjbR family DNA-binding protein [Pseudarthrobacter sp. J1738]|uniref:MmcQ/YjbR family DNA-binding protein n=1 Tax=unclassified Pseudarthrobacter TaxID=2647000 RepID=UPI003D29F3A5